MVGTLAVRLNETLVGTLTNVVGDYTIFAFDPAYAENPNRPILSQSFIDENEQLIRVVPRTHTVAPNFFSNLLPEPESALRSLIAKQRGLKKAPDFPFLRALGSDLPGAVVLSIVDDGGTDANATGEDVGDTPAPLRFSLAGMQLKFSASMIEGRFSITRRTEGVPWIVKLPTNAYPRLPENEFAMMRFASAIGLNVPQIELRDLDSVGDLPRGMPGLRAQERAVYAIARFDRSGGTRVHVEDFNQIVSQKPNEKYENKTTDFVGNVIGQLCEPADVEEFVRRVVFGVLIGNDDMHLKNWAVTYPDERNARLAPLYDFVCTRAYFPEGELALTIGGERRFDRISRQTLRDFAKRAQLSQAAVARLADDVCERVRSEWPGFKTSIADETLVDSIDLHLSTVPLYGGR